MTLVLEVPDPSGVPAGCWVALGVLGWYALAAAIVRWTDVAFYIGPSMGYGNPSSVHPMERVMVWLLSPFLFPLFGAFVGASVRPGGPDPAAAIGGAPPRPTPTPGLDRGPITHTTEDGRLTWEATG